MPTSGDTNDDKFGIVTTYWLIDNLFTSIHQVTSPALGQPFDNPNISSKAQQSTTKQTVCIYLWMNDILQLILSHYLCFRVTWGRVHPMWEDFTNDM